MNKTFAVALACLVLAGVSVCQDDAYYYNDANDDTVGAGTMVEKRSSGPGALELVEEVAKEDVSGEADDLEDLVDVVSSSEAGLLGRRSSSNRMMARRTPKSGRTKPKKPKVEKSPADETKQATAEKSPAAETKQATAEKSPAAETKQATAEESPAAETKQATAEESPASEGYDDYYDYSSGEQTCVKFGDKCISPEDAANVIKVTASALEKSSKATSFLRDKVGKLKNMLTRERASHSMPQCDDKWATYFPRYCGLAKKCNGLGPKQCQCLLCVASSDLTDGALVGFVPPPLVGTFWSKLASGCSRNVMSKCLTPIPTFDDMLNGTSRRKEVTPVDGLVALAETTISVEQWTFFLNRFGEHSSNSTTLGDLVKTLNQTAWNGVTKEFSAMDEFEKRIARSELKVMRQTYYDAMEKEIYKLLHCDSYELAKVLLRSSHLITQAKAQKDQLCPESVNGGKCQSDTGLPFVSRLSGNSLDPRNTGYFYFFKRCDSGAHDPEKCKTVCEATCHTAFDEAWSRCDASMFHRVQTNGKIETVSDEQASKNQDEYCKGVCSTCSSSSSSISSSAYPFLRVGSIPEDRSDRDATCVYEPYGYVSDEDRLKLKAPITAMCLPGKGTNTSAGPSTDRFFTSNGGSRRKSQRQILNFLTPYCKAAMYLVSPEGAPLRPFTLSDMDNLDLEKAKFAEDDRETPFSATGQDQTEWDRLKEKLSEDEKCARVFTKLAADTDKTYERMLAAKGIDLNGQKTTVGRRRLSQMNHDDSLS